MDTLQVWIAVIGGLLAIAATVLSLRSQLFTPKTLSVDVVHGFTDDSNEVIVIITNHSQKQVTLTDVSFEFDESQPPKPTTGTIELDVVDSDGSSLSGQLLAPGGQIEGVVDARPYADLAEGLDMKWLKSRKKGRVWVCESTSKRVTMSAFVEVPDLSDWWTASKTRKRR